MDEVAIQLDAARDCKALTASCSGFWLPWLSGVREVLDKLAIADDRLVIDQFLINRHSCFFPGCRESAPVGSGQLSSLSPGKT